MDRWSLVQRYLAGALLRVLLPATAAGAVLGLIMSLVLEFYLERLAVGALFAAATLIPWKFYRKGEHLRGIRILLGSLYFITVAAVMFSGGIYEPAYVTLFVVLTMTVWFVPVPVVVAFLVAFLAIGLSATYLAHLDLIPSNPPPNGVWYSVVMTCLASIIAVILVTVRRRLQASLEDVRRTSTVLTSVFSAIDETVLVLNEKLVSVEIHGNDSRTSPEPLIPGISMDLSDLLFTSAPSRPGHDETVADRLRRVIRERRSERFTISYTSDSESFIECNAAPLDSIDEESKTGVAVLMRDATAETMERRHWAQGQQMAAIGQLASGIAHDFNNILGSIRASSALLDARDDPDQVTCIQTITDATQRAAVLTRSMLLHAGAASDPPSKILAASLLNESMSLLAPALGPNVNLSLQVEQPTLYFLGVPAEIQGIIVNLAINGAHATDNRGEVAIRLRGVRLSSMDRPLGTEDLHSGDYAVIDVRDDGSGIEHQQLEHIFRPFFTTKMRGQGTGLGLSNAIATARRAGGTITVDSAPGMGSTFSVWLPSALPEQAAEDTASRRVLSHQLDQLNLVIIDDDPLMRRVLSLAMKRLQISTRICGSGEEGLQVIRSAPEDVDAILLDLLMPGMSGLEVLRELQRLPHPPKTILMTGFSENENVEFALANGASAVVYKPFNLDELTQIIGDIVFGAPFSSQVVSSTARSATALSSTSS